MSESGEPDRLWIPYLPADEPWLIQAFPLYEHGRYIQRLGFDEKGRLVEWVVIQSRWRDDRWWQVAVYDTHKQVAHVHLFNRQGQRFTRIDLRPITCYKDVEESLDDVTHYLTELGGWQENERRSNCGR